MTFQPTTNQGEFNPADYDIDRITRIITASVLGDGNLQDRGKNARYRTAKTVGHGDYLDWIRNVCELIVPTKTYAIPESKNFKGSNYVSRAIDRIESRTHPLLTELYGVYYANRMKVVPESLELDAEQVAILLMDDGCRNVGLGYIVICVDGFDLASVEILQEQFIEVTGLPWTIAKTSRLSSAGDTCYNLYLPRRYVAELASMLKPFVFSSYYYKLALELDGVTEIPLKIKSI